MRVLHSGYLGTASGGPAMSTYLTLKGLQQQGVNAQIIMPPLCDGDRMIADDIVANHFNPQSVDRIGYSPNVDRTLKSLGIFDIYHVQGVWEHYGHCVARFARRCGKPYLFTLRGMLYPQALAHSKLFKRLWLKLFLRNDLSKAACIQATCAEELDHYRNLGFRNPVAVIPNPIDITPIVPRQSEPAGAFTLGYLGRIHPRKRIERLIYALDSLKAKAPDMRLIIIGGGDEQYERFLRGEVSRLNLDSRVEFTGFVNGKEKDDAIRRISVLAVPSDFENFGNIVIEALARAIPVIASKGTPWQSLETNGCGWWIDNDQDSINRTVLEAYSLQQDHRISMGMNGRKLVEQEYSVEHIGSKMAELYRWVGGGGPKPEFVHTI